MAYRMTVIVRQVMPDDAVQDAQKEFPSLAESDAVKASVKKLESELEQDFPGAEVFTEVEVV